MPLKPTTYDSVSSSVAAAGTGFIQGGDSDDGGMTTPAIVSDATNRIQ